MFQMILTVGLTARSGLGSVEVSTVGLESGRLDVLFTSSVLGT